jgi:hypothetical protein
MTSQLDETKKLMGALVRMKPKPHEAMKVGKPAKQTHVKRKRVKKTEKTK